MLVSHDNKTYFFGHIRLCLLLKAGRGRFVRTSWLEIQISALAFDGLEPRQFLVRIQLLLLLGRLLPRGTRLPRHRRLLTLEAPLVHHLLAFVGLCLPLLLLLRRQPCH